MTKISVITPTNSEHWFAQARESMMRQSLTEWEWIVLWNGGAFVPSDDPRIVCVRSQIGSTNVGALKREACMHATAPFVVEFDHDDELHTECLAEVLKAFESTGADFVYSDDAHVLENGKPYLYDAHYGWDAQPMAFVGRKSEMLMVDQRPLFVPQNLSRIWHAPDHVRAWRLDTYWKAGGHDPALKICDDLDLMHRIFLTGEGGFHHIPQCLYKYVVHGNNTWLKNQKDIQQIMLQMHDRRIEELAQRAYGSERSIDLGGGIDSPKGWTTCDVHDAKITADLNGPWPFEDSSVGVFRAHDVIEHLKDPIHTMNEAWRSLAHGGLLLIEVPSTDGRGAFQDPTHVSFWNANSFWYYTRKTQARYIEHAGLKARFQAVRIIDYFPSDWHRQHNIPYVKAHLAAIKDGPRLHGAYEL